jgi:hypothetical protein
MTIEEICISMARDRLDSATLRLNQAMPALFGRDAASSAGSSACGHAVHILPLSSTKVTNGSATATLSSLTSTKPSSATDDSNFDSSIFNCLPDESQNEMLKELVSECANVFADNSLIGLSSSSSSMMSSSTSSSSSSSSSFTGQWCDTKQRSNSNLMERVPSVACVGDLAQYYDEQVTEEPSNVDEQSPRFTGSDLELLVDSPSTLRNWRGQMLDWSFLLVDSCHIPHEVVHVAFDLLDRFVTAEVVRTAMKQQQRMNSPINVAASTASALPPITRDDYQLYAMTCLFLAVKVYMPYPQKLSVQSLVELSRHFYTVEDIEHTERDILQVLEWRVHSTTVTQYCGLYLQVLAADDFGLCCDDDDANKGCDHKLKASLHEQCARLAKLALSEVSFKYHDNSLVALVIMLMAIRSISKDSETSSDCSNDATHSTLESRFASQVIQAVWCNEVATNATSVPTTTMLPISEIQHIYQQLEELSA